MRVVGADALRAALPMAAAIDALDAAFREEDPARAGPVRSAVDTPAGSLLLMPASGPRGVGVKLVTLTESNPGVGLPFVQAAYLLFDGATQTPVAVLDGSSLTALRTAAVSGVATRHLARPDAHRLVLFGAGVQATAHLEAMTTVRPVDEVVVVSRSIEPAQRLVDRASSRGVRARLGTPEAVGEADLVCTCTTASMPVITVRVPDGAHLNAVGAYRPDTREIDTETVRRARLVVETREVAHAEAGDLLIPIAEGAIDPTHVVADLHELTGGVAVRRRPDEVTLFVSVGMAFEDLVIAGAVVEALG